MRNTYLIKNFSKCKKYLSSFISLPAGRQGQLSSPFGFTLIELLIVISIIGILATLVLASSTNPLLKGRDARRKSDLRQIQSALEMYREDSTGSTYPGSITSGNSLVSGSVTYMKKIPYDPLNSAPNVYTYTPGSGNKTYTLKACLENLNDPQGEADSICGTGAKKFQVEPQ